MKQLVYLALWFIRARFFGKRNPLQTVIFITNRCNLSCRHCLICGNLSPIEKSFAQVREELEYSYGRGSRFVDFEGGEPTLWKDGDKTLNDLIILAKTIGFFSCTLTTNAWDDFSGSEADSIWVSMDGVGEVHDDIRGKGAFERLEKNIAQSGHPAVSVNMVVNKRNYTGVTRAIKYVKNNPYIRSFSLNFHTPTLGTGHLYINTGTRSKVVKKVLWMKMAGYPIMNSFPGLRLLKREKFRKQCWITNFIMVNGLRLDECPGKRADICEKCGFGMAAEMHSVFYFKPGAMIAGLRLRMQQKNKT